MQFLICFLFSQLLLSNITLACSTFSFGNKNQNYVAKSYDWSLGHGMVAINKKNIQKTSLTLIPEDTPITWVSSYGSATFSQFGLEFPLSGINEKGLVVEIMWLDESAYPTFKESNLPVVNELQWIQFILDQASSTDEAIKLAESVRINPVFANVHYLICDLKAKCASFEYVNKKLVISYKTFLTYKALTNNTYNDSLNYLVDHKGFGGVKKINFSNKSSLNRFTIANYQSSIFDISNDDPFKFGFESLYKVSQGTYSKWNLVYDQSKLDIAFRTLTKLKIKKFNLNDFNLSCKKSAQILDINQSFKSSYVSGNFKDSTLEFNKKIIDKNIFLDKDKKKLALRYPELFTKCLD